MRHYSRFNIGRRKESVIHAEEYRISWSENYQIMGNKGRKLEQK